MILDSKVLKRLKDYDRDDILDMVGLKRASSADWVVPTISALGIGMIVGAGLGMLFASKPGVELRHDLKNRISGATEDISVNKAFPTMGTSAEKAPRSV